MALLYASKALDEVKANTNIFDQQIGVQVLQNALRVPLKTIASNAGGQTAALTASGSMRLQMPSAWQALSTVQAAAPVVTLCLPSLKAPGVTGCGL